jgi:hypothetical protein
VEDQSVTEDIIALLIPFAAFAMVIAIVWLASREKLAKARLRTELQRELLTKFSTARELTEFLNSEGSKMLLQESPRRPADRTIRLVVGGTILLALGGGFFFSGTDDEATAICTAVGLGLIVSAALSYWLAQKLKDSEESPGYTGERPSQQ